MNKNFKSLVSDIANKASEKVNDFVQGFNTESDYIEVTVSFDGVVYTFVRANYLTKFIKAVQKFAQTDYSLDGQAYTEKEIKELFRDATRLANFAVNKPFFDHEIKSKSVGNFNENLSNATYHVPMGYARILYGVMARLKATMYGMEDIERGLTDGASLFTFSDNFFVAEKLLDHTKEYAADVAKYATDVYTFGDMMALAWSDVNRKKPITVKFNRIKKFDLIKELTHVRLSAFFAHDRMQLEVTDTEPTYGVDMDDYKAFVNIKSVNEVEILNAIAKGQLLDMTYDARVIPTASKIDKANNVLAMKQIGVKPKLRSLKNDETKVYNCCKVKSAKVIPFVRKK